MIDGFIPSVGMSGLGVENLKVLGDRLIGFGYLMGFAKKNIQ